MIFLLIVARQLIDFFYVLDVYLRGQNIAQIINYFCGEIKSMNMNSSTGLVKAASLLGSIKKRTWIILGVVVLTVLGLLLWLLISVASWLLGKAPLGDWGALIPENALAQIEQLAPELAQPLDNLTQPLEHLAQPLENLVPEAKTQALELVEQAQNVVPELKNQVEQMVPNIELGAAIPERDVSGTDVEPVARFPGLVRTSFARNGDALVVDYQGRASLQDVLDHYVAGFVAAGFAHEVVRAETKSEQHKFLKEGASTEMSLTQMTGGRLSVQFSQKN
jgi:hypothetical protein